MGELTPGGILSVVLMSNTRTVVMIRSGLAVFQPEQALMVSWIWQAMSGNGLQIGIKKTITAFHLLPIPMGLDQEIIRSCAAVHGTARITMCAQQAGGGNLRLCLSAV